MLSYHYSDNAIRGSMPILCVQQKNHLYFGIFYFQISFRLATITTLFKKAYTLVYKSRLYSYKLYPISDNFIRTIIEIVIGIYRINYYYF